MYQSTIFGTSVRPRAPPNAVPFHTRPVTSWNGRVAISWPAPGDADDDARRPSRLWQHSSAWRISFDVADALEAVVGAAAGELDEVRDEVARRPPSGSRSASCRTSRRAPRARGLRSTPTIMSAPAMRAPCTTLRPMPPRPNTTTLAPGSTFAVLMHRADARRDAAADVADLVERRVARGSSRPRSRAAPCARRRSSSPCSGGSAARRCEKRLVPSGIRPLPCVARMACAEVGLARSGSTCTARHSGV